MHVDGELAERETYLGEQLRQSYGLLISAKELGALLRFPTTNALYLAHSRGAMDFPLFELPGRPGKFALARDVARYIECSYGRALDRPPGPDDEA